MIGVLATLRVRDGMRTEFERIFQELAQQVRRDEPGNLLYQLYVSRAEPNTYRVLEIYSSDEDLEAHRASQHFRAAGEALMPLLAGAPAIEVLDGVA